MKIALVSFGHIDVVLPLIKQLRENNVDIENVFCFSQNRKSESILDFNSTEVNKGFLSSNKKDEILPLELKNYLTNTSYIQFFIFHNLKLRSISNLVLSFTLVRKLKEYDIIHINGTNGILPFVIFLLRKKRLVFTLHDIHSHSGERTRFNFAERLNKFLIKSRYPLIIQNIHDYKELLRKYPANPIKFNFIPFGVLDPYKEFKNSKSTKALDILFFGRISPYKGIEYLIDAIKILFSEGLRVNTIIAGNGNLYFNTEGLDKYGIQIINRHIKNGELCGYLEQAKMVVCPYTDATQSGVVMTAFAFGTPVIASDVGSFSEVIKDGVTGYLVPPANPEELAIKIKYQLSNPESVEKMRSKIIEFTNSGTYSWKEIGIKMKALYESV